MFYLLFTYSGIFVCDCGLLIVLFVVCLCKIVFVCHIFRISILFINTKYMSQHAILYNINDLFMKYDIITDFFSTSLNIITRELLTFIIEKKF